MREAQHPDARPQVAGSARLGRGLWIAGLTVWSFALTRFVAEAFLLPLPFTSAWAATGVSLAGAGTALAVLRLASDTLRRRLARVWPLLLLPLAYVLAPRPVPLAGLVLLLGGLALAVLLVAAEKDLSSRSRWALGGVLVLVVFGLYLRTLGRAVGEADTFEFQVLAPALGIAHPTGYPLYILLGKLFTLLPVGSMAWRVNLTSAVFTTTAVFLLYRTLERSGREPIVALLAALALAFSPLLWSQAVVAEVYGLNLLFVAAVLALLADLLLRRAGRHGVYALAFLLGLSLTNHLTMVLLLPSVALALRHSRIGWRDRLAAAGLFVLGLAVYAYIPLRWPALHDGQWMSAGEFVAYVTGQQFGGALQPGLLKNPTRYGIVGRVLLEPFGWAGLALALLGLGWLITHRRRLALVTAVAFFTYCLYGLAYLVPDISVFLLPTHLLLALWAGLGAALLVRQARRHGQWLPALLVVLFALLPFSQIWRNLPRVDQSDQVEDEQWGRAVLDLPLPQGAAILADGEKFAPLYYLQQVEGLRPDLDLVVHFAEQEYRTDLATRLEAGQPVYLARYLPHLEDAFLRSLGPLVEVGVTPLMEQPSQTTARPAHFGEAMELLAYRLESDTQGRALRHLTLYWRAAAPLERDLEVRLRLVDEDGEVAWTSDGTRPVGGNYPTNAWPPRTVVPDYHAIPLPAWLAPGRYALQVALFPRFGGEGLGIHGQSEAWMTLEPLQVEAPPQQLPPLSAGYRAILGPAWLVGFDAPSVTPAASPLWLELGWLPFGEEGELRWEWVDNGGHVVNSGTAQVAANTARSRLQVLAPPEPGRYSLSVGWEGAPARCRWLARATPGCFLQQVEVQPAQEDGVIFGGRIALLQAQSGAEQLHPGEALPLVLHWRALRAMEADYTVTVQLIGPDGKLYGQVDAWPVQGTFPTSQWAAGQEVRDPYQVPLRPDSPPGRYRVLVGWYLLETMERLPRLDADGRPVADHAVIGELDVSAP